MLDRRVTFLGETPETSDVVLCKFCGDTLHAPEHDVFWENTVSHFCQDARIQELEAVILRMSQDYMISAEHHPDHVLVRADDFFAAVSVLN